MKLISNLSNANFTIKRQPTFRLLLSRPSYACKSNQISHFCEFCRNPYKNSRHWGVGVTKNEPFRGFSTFLKFLNMLPSFRLSIFFALFKVFCMGFPLISSVIVRFPFSRIKHLLIYLLLLILSWPLIFFSPALKTSSLCFLNFLDDL